jgi:hypothetical protein
MFNRKSVLLVPVIWPESNTKIIYLGIRISRPDDATAKADFLFLNLPPPLLVSDPKPDPNLDPNLKCR